MTIDQLVAGQIHESGVVITEEMIDRFAHATGDQNPIHLDEDYAKGTIFKARVAHGMLLAGILSGVLGTQFPGLGTIYLSQTLKFLKPVFIGDEISFAYTAPRIMGLEYRLNQLAKENAPLDSILSEVKKGMEKVAKTQEEIGPPFQLRHHYQRGLPKGGQIRESPDPLPVGLEEDFIVGTGK